LELISQSICLLELIFDCNHPTFNYEASATGKVDLHLFDHSVNAFTAKAVYGRQGGQPAEDEIYVRVFGKTIYDRQLPHIDCRTHAENIASAFPGFSVSYVIWVSVIPITFTASASLGLDLSWNYDVCVDQLSAQVELVPKATLVVGGDAEIDLLIIKAGVKLDGSFEASIPPQVRVDGSLCSISFDVKYVSRPLAINFDGYFAVESCFLWIFDCHWKQEKTVNIFSWQSPSYDTVLYSKTWKIK